MKIENAKSQGVFNIAVDIDPNKHDFDVMFGLNSKFAADKAPEITFTPGMKWRIDQLPLLFGIGFPIGLTKEAENWGVILDIEIEFDN